MNRIERRGHRVAAERDYGAPRSFAQIAEQEPSIRELHRKAHQEVQRLRRHARWRRRLARVEWWSTWLVVAGTLLLLARIFAPFVFGWWHG